EYEVLRDPNPEPAPRTGEKYSVRVRDGKVESVTGPDGKPPRPGEFEFGSMDDLFDRIDNRLRADRETGGPRPFVKADFDPPAGPVPPPVHSVRRPRERLETRVNLPPLTPSPP